MNRGLVWIGVLALALYQGTTALAQQTSFRPFELERLELNPGAEGSLVVGTGELLAAGQFRLSAAGHYQHRPLTLFQQGQSAEAVSGRSTLHVAAAWAPTRWLQVGAQVPVVMLQSLGPGAPELTTPTSFLLGTPTVGVRLGLLTQSAQGGFDVAVGADVGLNVGNKDAYARDDGPRFLPRVMAGRHLGSLRLALDVGLMLRPGGRITEEAPRAQDELGNEVRLAGALASTGRRMRWELNVRGMVPLSKQPGSMELLPGLRYLVNPSLEVFGLAGVGLGKTPGTPLFRVLAGGSFGSVLPRQGPGEASVRCDLGQSLPPAECPDRDDDGDGLRNGLDRCPSESGNGEPDGCPIKDTDKDGIMDRLDACPSEPGPASRQGCPVRDADGDGVEDEEDRCPQESGPRENQGCPLLDKDKDGISNDDDRCPDEPGPPERQGCPEEDLDKDGVPNREDMCVNAKGEASNLGCPAHELPLVAIAVDHLDLRGNKVAFEKGQARLRPGVSLVLDWVARAMREHPEIPLVLVGAHTDDQGMADPNRLLTQQRAEVVRRYLIDKGVPAERLEARGYGPDVPIDTNLTANGRENNRRVEFKILREGNRGTEAPRR